MYPIKNVMDDYLKEINRLIPKTSEHDVFDTPHTSQPLPFTHTSQGSPFTQPAPGSPFRQTSQGSPFTQPSPGSPFTQTSQGSPFTKTSPGSPFTQTSQGSPFSNSTVRSSSSTDSVTPESCDIPLRGSSSLSTSQESPIYEADSPYIVRKQRPIVGRRLMAQDIRPTFKENRNYVPETQNAWQQNETYNLSAISHNIFNEHRGNSSFYELFPSDNKYPMEPKPKANVSDYAPSGMSSYQGIRMPQNIMEPIIPVPLAPNRYLKQGSSKVTESGKVCTFCRKNGETPLVYMTHMLKERVGNKHIVTCPILRSHVCSTCGAFGDDAHTITYCPVLRSTNNGQPLLSTTITLKNTRIKSNGRRRY